MTQGAPRLLVQAAGLPGLRIRVAVEVISERMVPE